MLAETSHLTLSDERIQPLNTIWRTTDGDADSGMLASSYKFHEKLESPISFVRREWRPIAVFGAGFAVVLLVGILTVDPAYFYPRLSTDSLLYHLKGLAFAETWHTHARTAINREPFRFVSMPGVLRSPFMIAFENFDDRLRAIQISNVLLVGITATLFAYVLSWAVPRKWHWLAIGYAFAFMLLSPDWSGNVFQLLADAPYAFFTVTCVMISTRVITSTRPVRTQWLMIGAAAICFAIAFLTRFTAPLVLVFIAALAAGRNRGEQSSRRMSLVAVGSAAVVVATLAAINWDTLSNRYLEGVIHLYWHFGSKPDMMKNLFALALPSQIIPNFHLLFREWPLVDDYHVRFGSSLRDLSLVALGLTVSAVTMWGMWLSRRRFAPEIVYTLAAIPVLTVIIAGTTRYLMAYEPFFWISFYAGASALAAPFEIELRKWRRAALACVVLVSLAGGAVLLRGRQGAAASTPPGYTRGHAREIAATFRALRVYLEKLPRDRTLLIGPSRTVGRWTVISNLNYYQPDSALRGAVATRDTYLLSECGSYGICRDFDNWDVRFRESVNKFGPFQFDLVFSREVDDAKARVYRLRLQ
jgi:hypothetical protein